MKQTYLHVIVLIALCLGLSIRSAWAQTTSYPELSGRKALRGITLDGCALDSLVVQYRLVVINDEPTLTGQLTWYGGDDALATCVSSNLAVYLSVDKGELRRWVSLPIAVGRSGEPGKAITEKRLWKELFLPVSEVVRGRDALDTRRRKGLAPEVAQALWASQPSVMRMVLTRPGGFGEDGLRRPDHVYEVSMLVLNERFSPDVVSPRELINLGLKTSYTTARDTLARLAQLYRGSVSAGAIFHSNNNVYEVPTNFIPFLQPGFAFLPMVMNSSVGYQVGAEYIHWFQKDRLTILQPFGILAAAQFYQITGVKAEQQQDLVPVITGINSTFDVSEVTLKVGLATRFFNAYVLGYRYLADGRINFPPLDRTFTDRFGEFQTVFGLGFTPLNRRQLRIAIDVLFVETLATRIRFDFKYFYIQANLDTGINSFAAGARYAW